MLIVFKNLVKSRVMLDFKVYKMMNDLESFCINGVLKELFVQL